MAQKHCTGVAFRFCQFKNFLHMICIINLHSTSVSVICFKHRSSQMCVRFLRQHVWVFHSSGMCYWLVILKESSAFIFKGLKGLRRMPIFLDSSFHGSPTSSPPDCIMWPVTTFVNYVYTIKITQMFRQLHIPLIFPCMAHELAHNYGHGPSSSKGWTPTS
jgi:hypothetical protein